MRRAVRLAAAIALAGLSAPLAAQAQGDPARLDDFAIKAQDSQVLQVDQLPSDGPRVGGSQASPDRAVATGQPPAPTGEPLPQLSAKGQSPRQAQLSKPGARPDESSAAVSSTAQSRPQGVVRIAGQDRCDPQLAGAALERCRRILELRAQEFSAPSAPQLSPEQRLLAEQRYDEVSAASRSADTRLRLASRDDPNADLPSNQELAELYLQPATQAPPPQAPADSAQSEQSAALAQVIDAIQAAASGGQARP